MRETAKRLRLANPFVIGRYAGADYFCDRKEELAYLAKCIKNGRDVAIVSPRRIGKSGLIEHYFAQEDTKKEYITIFIDIYATSSISELVAALGHAIFYVLSKEKDSVWQQFVASLKSLRPTITFDAISGLPTLSISAAGISHPEHTLQEIFDYLNSSPRPVIIAIDEFQAVSKYSDRNAEALLRAHIQHCPNTRFIFAGSEQSVMTAMFSSKHRPFYQSCLMMHLNPIAKETYAEFAMEKFNEYGKTGCKEVFETIYNDMNGITWFMQMMLNELFAITPAKGTLRMEQTETAYQNIIGEQSYSYKELMAKFTPMQRNLIVYLAMKGPVRSILSAESLEQSGFRTAASIQSACRALEKAGVATKADGAWHLYDVFFAMWVRRWLRGG